MPAKLLEKSFVLGDFARQTYFASPAAGTPIETVMTPEYWAHVCRKLNPHDIIEVIPEDGKYYARLIVLSAGKLWAKVQKLEYTELASRPSSNAGAELFEAKWMGPMAKWRVVRKSDNEIVSNDSFQTEDDAQTWINNNAKMMIAA